MHACMHAWSGGGVCFSFLWMNRGEKHFVRITLHKFCERWSSLDRIHNSVGACQRKSASKQQSTPQTLSQNIQTNSRITRMNQTTNQRTTFVHWRENQAPPTTFDGLSVLAHSKNQNAHKHVQIKKEMKGNGKLQSLLRASCPYRDPANQPTF
jgi:hypothetical protein